MPWGSNPAHCKVLHCTLRPLGEVLRAERCGQLLVRDATWKIREGLSCKKV